MGRETLKIVLSLLGAGALALCVLVGMQAVLLSGHARSSGAELFRFQLSSMFALAVFAGVAIVVYARLSRREPPRRRMPGRPQSRPHPHEGPGESPGEGPGKSPGEGKDKRWETGRNG